MKDELVREPLVCPICGSPNHRSRTGHMFWEQKMERSLRRLNDIREPDY